MNLLVIRHVITESNLEKTINGQRDEVISDAGRKQIPVIVEQLHAKKIDTIFSSPLKRAMETAMPIATDHGVDINVDRRIIEIAAGSLTGKPYEATEEAFGVKSTDLLNSYAYDFSAYGGETSEQVRERVQGFLNDLGAKPFNDVLIVTHGGILRWINYLCTGQKISGQPNGSVLELTL